MSTAVPVINKVRFTVSTLSNIYFRNHKFIKKITNQKINTYTVIIRLSARSFLLLSIRSSKKQIFSRWALIRIIMMHNKRLTNPARYIIV